MRSSVIGGRWPTGLLLPRPISAWLLAAAAAVPLAAHAQDSPAGRWQGRAEIPGAPLTMVIDLAPDATKPGAWIGSVILPGRGVKGAPLAQIEVRGNELRFTLAQATPPYNEPVPEVRLARYGNSRLLGELRQGALTAPLELTRSGSAQVDRPVPATALSSALLGTWVGRYELGGVPREVTLTLANNARGLGGGELLIVGKRRSQLAIDHVVQGREYVTLSAQAAALRIEGRHADGTIDGRLVQGPFEATLVLRRVTAQKSS